MYRIDTPAPPRFAIQRWGTLILVLCLLGLAAFAWTDIYFRSRTMTMTGIDPLAMATQDRPLWRDLSLFLPMWAIMMAAMMLPAFLPMAITFSNVSRRRRATSHTYVPIWVFVAGYVVLWSLSGVPGYLSKLGLETLAGQFPSVQTGAALVGALVVIGAGLYQLTPWKDRCLSHCRNPMSFVMHDWQEGYAGAFHMGINQGWYCLGCCWALMLVMLPLGIMNLMWMAGLAVVILLERLAHTVWVSRISGLALTAAGLNLALRLV